MRLEVVQGPHVLFRGANGKVTAGVTVRNLDAPEGAEQDHSYPYQVKWDVNTGCLEKRQLPGLEGQQSELLEECQRLERANEDQEG